MLVRQNGQRDRSGRSAVVAYLPALTYVIIVIALWWWADGRIEQRPPLLVVLVPAIAVAIAVTPAVQERLGGPGLHDRTWLRIAVPALAAGVAVSSTGLPFLSSVLALSIAGRRMQGHATRTTIAVGALFVVLSGPSVAVFRALVYQDASPWMPLKTQNLALITVSIFSAIAFVVMVDGARLMQKMAQQVADEERRHLLRLEHAATHDPLTNLWNVEASWKGSAKLLAR